MTKKIIIYSLAFLAMAGCRSLPKTAKDYFEQAKYEPALGVYKQIAGIKTATTEQKGNANFMIGECYRLSNRVALALPYYKAAMDLGYTNKVAELPFYYAQALKANEKYDLAAEQFKLFAENATNNDNKVAIAKREATSLALIRGIYETKSFTTIKNCTGINTPDAEFSPAILQKKVVFSSSRRKEKVFETNGQGFNDLYVFNFKDSANCQGDIVPFFGLNINAYYSHEACPTFSPDGKTMIFARSNKGEKKEAMKEVKLFKSTFNGTEWTEPTVLSPVSNDTLSGTWDSNPALSPDGNTLYFASNRKDDSFGGIDIFKATKDANGGWGNVQNLGKPFNTEGDDMFPYMSADGRFFFASDGHVGLGGLDIFYLDTTKTKQTDGSFKTELVVRNAGKPMNSTADDFGIVFGNKTDGYFTSNRTTDEAKGDDDIFAFKNDSIYQKKVTYYLQGITYAEDELGKQRILGGVNVVLKNDKGEVIEKVVSTEEGKFKFPKPVAVDAKFELEGEKGEQFLKRNLNYNTMGKGVKDITKLPKRENEIYFDTLLVLRENIFKRVDEKTKKVITPEIEILYDYDKADIRPDAAKILDEFYDFLKDYFAEYPTQVLEMGSHTDSRGSDKYNQKLSQRRAESAVAYLVKKGISAERIRAKGYGEYEPKIKNAKTEAEHQANRRTTVKIIKG
jgi:peptidoglycan-associated lipoprotein